MGGCSLLLTSFLALPTIVQTVQADEVGDSSSAILQELETLRKRIEELEAREATARKKEAKAEAGASVADSEQPFKMKWGGQYRVNGYTADDDMGDDPTSARVRIRQSLDVQFDENLSSHLQVELGHTSDNITTTNNSSRGTNLAVRHAVMAYNFQPGESNLTAKVGILPLADHFGDVLFSADWDYNPVAASVERESLFVDGDDVRLFAATLNEGDEVVTEDDFTHIQFDYRWPVTPALKLNAGVGFAAVEDVFGDSRDHYNYGFSGEWQLDEGMLLRGFILGSKTEKQLVGASSDGEGVAVKLELAIPDVGLDIMATYASGDDDGSGFLPVMALAPTNGYWGYTGLLTVQGPTDTGFDGDSVNISNNGYGLTSVQLRYRRPITEKAALYLAGGWYGNTDAPDGREDRLGWDSLAMVSYSLNPYLTVDVGGAYARLEDSVSGYWQNANGGADFNQAPGTDRDKYAIFSRIQIEF